MAFPAHASEFHLEDVLHVFRKRYWVIIVAFLTIVTTVMIWTFRQPRIYRATTRLEISNDRPNLVHFKDIVPTGPESYWGTMHYLQTQYQIMRSRTVAETAIAILDKEHELGPDLVASADPPSTFRGRIQVTPVKDSMLVDLSYEHTDPQLAARYADVAARAYIQEDMNRRLRATQEAVTWLSDQLETYRTKKHEAEAEVLGFKKEHSLVSLEEKHNLVLKKLTARTTTYEEVNAERVALDSEYKKLKELASGGLENKKALVELFNEEQVSDLADRIDEADQQIDELSQRYKPAHPKMKEALDARDALIARIDREVQRTLDARRAKIDLLKAKESRMAIEVESAKNEALDLEQKITEYRDLMSQVATNQKFYDSLDTRLQEADLTSLIRYDNIRVVDEARLPGAPISPRVPVNFLAALVAGLLGGIGLAFLLEYLDRTVKTTEDVERGLGLPLLGGIPGVPAGAESPELYARDNPQSHVAESWRSVRTNLLFAQPDNPPRIILVTSAAPQEGKTTTVINLGLVLAQSGVRTLIIDSDLRRPRLHKVFGVGGVDGLTQMIVGTVEDAVVDTGIDNLWVLPSGAIPPNPAELLGSESFRKTLLKLSERFDRILLDSPPIVPVTDAAVLCPSMDGVVLVARAGSTPRDLLAQAYRRLTDVSARIFGVVLNAVSTRGGRYGTYAYRYSYYRSESESGSESPAPATGDG